MQYVQIRDKFLLCPKVIQNDSTLMRVMSSMLSEASGRASLSGFIQTLEEFHNYSVAVLEKPFEVNLQVNVRHFEPFIKLN